MLRLHRFLLLCLLAVAIPLQGFAATSMTACGAQPVDAPHAMSHLDMEAGIERAFDSVAKDMPMHHDMAAHSEGKAPAHKGTCSACAACCVIAAPGTPFTPSFAAVQAGHVELPAHHTRVAFLTDGPERPPRNRLA